MLIEIVLGMTIHEVEVLVETGEGQDNPVPNLEGKIEGHHDLGLGQVPE